MIINRTFAHITDKVKGDSLKARCVRSSVVLGIGAFIAKGLAFASKMILTRLLAPEAMGLMVLIISLTAMFEVLTEVGIKQSVIQNKKGAQAEYLNMAWWFQSLRGLGLYAIAFFLTPWICGFYFDKPELLALHSKAELVLMVRTMFLVFLFGGFVSPRIHVLEKEFQFGKSVLIKQGSGIFGTVITIILAFMMQNVWALVIGFTSSILLLCVSSHVFCPFKPRLSYHRDSFKELYRFARGMLGLPVLTYIAFNIDVLVVGKLVSAYLVGMYGMAFVLARAPQDIFNRIILPISLPAFAEKQNDNKALCKAIIKLTRIIALVAIPVVVLAIIFSKSTLSVVFGVEYSTVSVPFSLMCISVVLVIYGTIVGNMFFGLGQPEKQRSYTMTCALILVISIYPAVKLFGLTGAASSVLTANLVALCVQINVMRKIIGIKMHDYVFGWLPGIGLGTILALLILSIKWIAD